MNIVTTLTTTFLVLSIAIVLAQGKATSVAELRKHRALGRDLGHGDYGNHTSYDRDGDNNTSYHRGGDNGRDHGVHTPTTNDTNGTDANTTESSTSLIARSSKKGGAKTAILAVALTLMAIFFGAVAAYYCCVSTNKKKTQQAMVTAAAALKQADLEEMTSASDTPTSSSNE